jgi:flavin reductase (DIM6/NTAB) family NADH-FMN oxidoreductase RutF
MTDTRAYRDALARFASGVAIVTTRDERGEPAGLTVSSFTSVSLEPPLILWCLDRQAPEFAAFEHCERFVVSVLGADQADLAWRFATLGNDRFGGMDWPDDAFGNPLPQPAIARFHCLCRERINAGDHRILLGEVTDYARLPGTPMIYVDSDFTRPTLE